MQTLTDVQLEMLKSLTTPTVANAIESFNVRMRNEGYTDQSIHQRLCVRTSRILPMVGYAVTAKVRTAQPPMRGTHYPDRNDWWNILQSAPKPKIMVIQDIDKVPGNGSVCGGIHGIIFKTLGCAGIVTNGAVRDVPELEKQQLAVFSGGVSPSHAYAHIVEIGTPVEIGGMHINNGDLLHGDQHGIVNIPLSIAADIYAHAQIQLAHELKVINYCHTPGFSVEKLRELVSMLAPPPEAE